MAETGAPGEFYARKRRSTRLLQAVPLTVAGRDAAGRPVREQTATLSLNCHGCRYFSRHRLEQNAWLTLEIPSAQSSVEPHQLRARVAWIQRSRRLQGLFQVGVEFEVPGNVWGIASPPEDWQQFELRAAFDPSAFERELQELLAVAEAGTHYQLLGVTALATPAQIKRNFYALARKFHPDRHMEHLEWAGSLHRLMDALALAYRTLTHEKSRENYDRQLTQSGAFTLGQNKSEEQKNAEECLRRAKECLRAENFVGSIVWLRKAVEIEPDSSKYHALLGRSLAAVPQYHREAVEHLHRAIELNSLNTFAHFQFAKLLEEMGLPWRARPHYQEVVELDPENAEARERLRQIDAAQEKQRSAETGFLHRILNRISK